jgi:hypothetical protein
MDARLDAETPAKVDALAARFHRTQATVLRHILTWGVNRGKSVPLDQAASPGPASAASPAVCESGDAPVMGKAERRLWGSDEAMTDTLLSDVLRLVTRVAAETRRVWADTAGLIAPAMRGLAMPSASGVCQTARLTAALGLSPWWLAVWVAFGAGATRAASPPAPQPAEVWRAEATFREAVQLWADEQFDALWERGLLSSRDRIPREAFVRGMRHRVVKPTCCWGRLRAVRVLSQATDEALVEAQVGVDLKTLGTTVVRSMLVYLRREEGVWRVRLEDFLTKPEDAFSGLRAPW